MEITTFTKDGHTVSVNSEDAWMVTDGKIFLRKSKNVIYATIKKSENFKGKSKYELLHRRVLGVYGPEVVCHLDGNGLNCVRSNLLIGDRRINGSSVKTKRKNAASRFRGVYKGNGYYPWRAALWDGGKYFFLGAFYDEILAAKAYDKEAHKRFGIASHLNFPNEI